MRLLEAIIAANHRASAGDSSAGLHPEEFAGALPLIALTCIDPRLNHLFPDVLGVREEDFIWLRNAGNIIFDPLSSMTRTLALACAVKGGREIAIIGHTDCRVRQASASELIDRFRALGVERSNLPENLVEFFGLFASERQNVLKSVSFVRESPLIGPKIPVHGLLVDIQSGRLEWIVNGYESLAAARVVPAAPGHSEKQNDDFLKLPSFDLGGATAGLNSKIGELTSALDARIGDAAGAVESKIGEAAGVVEEKVGEKIGEATAQLRSKVGEAASKARKWLSDLQVVEESRSPSARHKAEIGKPPLAHVPPPIRVPPGFPKAKKK